MSGKISQLAAGAAASAAVFLASGCGAPKQPEWNVVVVLVDTLRADHLSLYGYERDTSPVLSSLDAVVFANATSQAACTFPSVNSLLTSRFPFHFLRADARQMSMRKDIPTLGELLQAEGYTTAAVSASPIVRKVPSQFNRQGGYDQGFQTFHEECLNADAACVNQAAFDILDRTQEPFFLYLHYMEPHNPYQPPSTHPRHFATFESEQWFIREGELRPIARMMAGQANGVSVSEEDKENLRALYDEEIRYFDSQFGLLLERLRVDNLLDRTILVVLSDHGEELFDHGLISHCRNHAYQSVIGTPLVMRIPGVAPAVRRQRVQNLDVVPTILDYLGYQDPGQAFDGASLRGVVEEDKPLHRYVFATQGTSRVIISREFKLILDLDTGTSQLFDLAVDPGETVDVSLDHPAKLEELRRIIEAWVGQVEGGALSQAESIRRADELRKELDAVGYL